ncbi:LytR/AlgR family response regulator transcription factor [Chitinophaga sp. 30R24]|uniref:LytR/AlgR family response regulator transcription factor n=1 Tax=Chitinophaga sp. 30R24 TaxID=3248838 RepID=UPI003B908674
MLSKKIIISQQNSIHLVDSEEIIFCKSDNSYTFIHLLNSRKLIVVKSLSKIAKEQLCLPGFIRVSQSYLVNINFISSINKKTKELILSNDQSIPFTTTLKELFTLMFDNNLFITVN